MPEIALQCMCVNVQCLFNKASEVLAEEINWAFGAVAIMDIPGLKLLNKVSKIKWNNGGPGMGMVLVEIVVLALIKEKFQCENNPR